MKVVYIAGPYRARTVFGRVLNILRARSEAKKWWAMGYAVVCPHMNSALFDRIAPETTFLDGYLEILCRCDELVLLKSWKKSAGSVIEKRVAVQRDMRIHYADGQDL